MVTAGRSSNEDMFVNLVAACMPSIEDGHADIVLQFTAPIGPDTESGIEKISKQYWVDLVIGCNV
jgi:hypothetical protein